MSPELRSGAKKQPTIQERALEDSPIVILAERTLSQPERLTNVAMKAGRIVAVWETTEPFDEPRVYRTEGERDAKSKEVTDLWASLEDKKEFASPTEPLMIDAMQPKEPVEGEIVIDEKE